MMPGARFFFYSMSSPLSCLMGGQVQQITIGYEGSLFSPSSPAALYSLRCIFIHHHKM